MNKNSIRIAFGCLVFLLAGCQDTTDKAVTSELLAEIDEATPSSEIQEDSIQVPVELINAFIDQEVEAEMRQYLNEGQQYGPFEIYSLNEDAYENWSEILWGRCCTEADLAYSETMSFAYSVNRSGRRYPFSNCTDTRYTTAFAFEPSDSVEITMKLSPKNNYFSDNEKGWAKNVIRPTDTILSKFQFTLINGYVKSRSTFYANARVKTLQLWYNDQYICDVLLKDTPRPQSVKLNRPFFKTDRIVLKPIEYYPGSTYNDVCISAFQLTIGKRAHPSINRTYKIQDYWD